MDWLLLEELDDDGARLVALRLIDGERRVLYEGPQDAPLRPALHPSGRAVAVDVRATDTLKGRGRSRVALVDLLRPGQRWPSLSVDPRWQVGGLVFSVEGDRFALEGAADGAAFADVYVFGCDLGRDGFDDELVGGVRNPRGLACARPVFLPDDRRVVYLLQTRPDGGWVPAVIDPARRGAAESAPGDLAPPLHTAVLADALDVVPEAGLVVDPQGGRVLCVTRVRGGALQRLVAVPLDGRPPRPLGKSHGRVESPALSADGRRVAYAADGRVWLGPVGGEMQPVAGEGGGEHHRGLCFSADGETLYFATHGPHGATIDACDLAAGVPYPVAQLGDVTALGLLPLPADPGLAAKLADRASTHRNRRAFIDGATSVTRLPEEGGLISPDTAVARIDVVDRAAEGDATMAGAPGEATVDGALDSLLTDPEGAALEATAMHAPLDPDGDDGEATAAVPTVDVPEAEPAPAPLPRPGRPAPLPRPGAPARARPLLRGPRPAAPLPAEPPKAPPAAPNAPPAAQTPAPPRPAAPPPPPAPSTVIDPPPMDEAPDDSVLELSVSSFDSLDGDSPRADFEGWMAQVPTSPEPGARLAELGRYAGDPRVGIAAVAWLESRMEKVATEGDEAALELIFAIAAVAHLRLAAARPQLRAMARRAQDRLEMQRAIPEAEAHFALAALRAIDDETVEFEAMACYAEYQSILDKIAGAMAEGSDVADRTRTLYLELYRQRMSEALSPTAAEEVDAAAREALELALQQELAREKAAAEKAAAEAAAAEAAAEAERRARAEAARRAAAQVGAALAQRASVADDAEWARRRAEVEGDDWGRLKAQAEVRARQSEATVEGDDWVRLKAQAEARARQSEATIEGDDWGRLKAQAEARARQSEATIEGDDWARLHAEAEARAAAERALAADRARQEAWAQQQAEAEARARQEAAEAAARQDEWARRQAAAAEAARAAEAERVQQAQLAAATRATGADRFNPLATGSALPAMRPAAVSPSAVSPSAVSPSAVSPARPAPYDPGPAPAIRAPRPMPPGTPDFGGADFGGGSSEFGPVQSGAWSESMVSAAAFRPAPKALSAIGFAGVVAGVVLALLGIKVGAAFTVFGLIWAAGGMALLGDKRATWLVGLSAYMLNAAFLVAYGVAGSPPPWIAPAGLVAGGLAAAVVGGCLLLPVFRERYRADRQRF